MLPNSQHILMVKHWQQADYQDVWQAMREYTDSRDSNSADQIWLVEHQAVFTQGQAGKAEHLLYQSDIPLVQSDRGGQITYHGPGQLVMYFLIDLKRHNISVKAFVSMLEQQLIDLLAEYDITAELKPGAPGVYVIAAQSLAKIASLGLRVRKGCSYHGLALNVDMDLSPFAQINPCGYAGMPMTQMCDFVSVDFQQVQQQELNKFVAALDYQAVEFAD